MSVAVASLKAYEKAFDKMVNFTFRNEVDINYCSTFSHYSEGNLKQLVCIWCNLNEETYDIRYKQEPTETKLSSFIKFFRSGETINTYQFLKILEFINYNIERSEIENNRKLTDIEKWALNDLDKAINEIKSRIIDEIPQYQAAKWFFE